MGLRRLGCIGLALAALAIAAAPAGARVHAALTPDDPFFRAWTWPADMTGLRSAWDVTLGNPSVVIAVLDTGVSPVPDLKGALLPGIDLVNGDADPADDNGHGTEVASVAAARTGNALGIAGVCGRCPILPVKVLDANGSGSAATVADGIRWAVDHGARVINLSLVSGQDDTGLDAAIAAAVAKGVVVVAAAGNAGTQTPMYPAAAAPDAIRVTAVDETGALFPWASHGPWVDLAAPGSVAAATLDGSFAVGAQGTSLAAPLVAGAAGLLLSVEPQLAPAAVKSLLLEHGTAPAPLDVASGRIVDAGSTIAAAALQQLRTPVAGKRTLTTCASTSSATQKRRPAGRTSCAR